MIDLDHITILRVEVGVDDHAARGRVDRRSVLGDEVDAFVERVLPAERIDAPAVVGGVPAALTGSIVGMSFLRALSSVRERLEHAELVAAVVDLAGERVELAREARRARGP